MQAARAGQTSTRRRPTTRGSPGCSCSALVAAIGGAVTGLVGGAFRQLLVELTLRRDELLGLGAVVRTRCAGSCPWCSGAVAAALARLVVRWAPEASGSGVQRVEAHIRGEVPPAPPRVLPAKFVGGLLSIGAAGLLLGREGPTVQMGASVGAFFARLFRMSLHDVRTVTCSLGGAGLGVAFNAPLGGSLFVFEEVAHAFRTRLVVATFVGTTCALAVSRLVVGGEPVLPVGDVRPGPGWLLARLRRPRRAAGRSRRRLQPGDRPVPRPVRARGAARAPEAKAAAIGAW